MYLSKTYHDVKLVPGPGFHAERKENEKKKYFRSSFKSFDCNDNGTNGDGTKFSRTNFVNLIALDVGMFGVFMFA